jgi:hypothetical protein
MRRRLVVTILMLVIALILTLPVRAQQKTVGPSSAGPRPNAVRPYKVLPYRTAPQQRPRESPLPRSRSSAWCGTDSETSRAPS